MTASPAGCGALSRLLYTSHSLIEGEGEDKLASIRKIAQASALKNRSAGLTGGLLFMDDTFIQVLEGPADKVEAIFEQICCDLRHEEVSLIDFVPVNSRMFGEWEMAFMADGEDLSRVRRGDLAEIRLLLGINAREAERQMREVLLDRAA